MPRTSPLHRSAFQAAALQTAIVVLFFSGSNAIANCKDRSDEKYAYFGDLHIHTGLSADAKLFGTDNRPDHAYKFARGGAIPLHAINNDNLPVEAVLARPLDFAAVTDHAEGLGGISLCTEPESPVYNTSDCKQVRSPAPSSSSEAFASKIMTSMKIVNVSDAVCGPDMQRCREAVSMPWEEIQQSAETWNSPCEFTTFVGYEYSPVVDGSKIHHNVIFRNEHVPASPISSYDVPSMIDFWRLLKSDCKESDTGCDVLSIPHNSNLSNGRMFSLNYGGETDLQKQKEIAALRSEMAPVVEIFQQKGDSECRNGLWNVFGGEDEWCEFEKYRDWKGASFEDCEDSYGAGALIGKGCVSRLDYTRYALAAGLAEEKRIGQNPHIFGLIGSTDAHDGSAADVEERVRDGKQRLLTQVEPGRMTTGGIAGVWAEENTRESIFHALRNREVFATSGPRIKPRFFAANHFPDNLCDQSDFIKKAYATGSPMGSKLLMSDGNSPHFLIAAQADPGTPLHPGTSLQRLQVIKAWAENDNSLLQKVYDIANASDDLVPASVDPSTCHRSGIGAKQMCTVWRDPDYDPNENAVYYARIIENPSCRYTGYACIQRDDDKLPSFCEDDTIPRQTQERAWTSPIWVYPAKTPH